MTLKRWNEVYFNHYCTELVEHMTESEMPMCRQAITEHLAVHFDLDVPEDVADRLAARVNLQTFGILLETAIRQGNRDEEVYLHSDRDSWLTCAGIL